MSHALAAIVAILTLAQPSDWPQFRGPNGSGVYEGSALPAELTKETTSWSVDVPFGRSSPVVLGARVFITGSDGDRLITLCLNRSDGKVLWRHEAKRARVEERLERLNDPASPTPAVDATGVYVFFPDLGLLALGHDGRERWRVPLGPFHSAYGLASSPIVVDGLVVQICDQQQGSFVVAIDAKSGRVAWRADRPETREGWFTPAVVPPRGSEPRTILLPGSARIEALDVTTGHVRWSIAGSGAENLGVPLIDGERMVVNVRGFAAPVFPTWSEVSAKYDADGNGQLSREEVRGNATYYEQFSYADVDRGGTITALEWTQMRDVGVGNFGLIALRRGGADGAPTVLWRVEKNLPYVPAPVLYRGVVYMVKNGGIVTAVDADSGRILKEARAGDALGQYFASPVAGDGKVYMASAEGKIAVIEAGPELRVLRVNDVADEIFGTPALVDGAVLVRTRSRLHSFRHQ